MSESLKRLAAEKALGYVESGTVLGLGSGSTAAEFLKLLGEALKDGRLSDVVGVPTSEATASLAQEVGVPLKSLDEVDRIDLAIDGADEVDANLNLIKGLGRALLREKMTEIHADQFFVIVDESKIVNKLGIKGPLPVEIVPFAYKSTLKFMEGLGCRVEFWTEEDSRPAMTDNGNYLAKCWFEGGIDNAEGVAEALSLRPGVVEHGLFLNMATKVIVAAEGGTREMQ